MRGIYFLLTLLFFTALRDAAAQVNVTPQTVAPLAAMVNESSGLVNVGGHLWTHNDSGGQTKLYEISKTNGTVIRTVDILNATNIDWEDLAFDSTYIYIGDFGNNSGSRTNLKIYRIPRADLTVGNSVAAETISFSYNDQTSWDPQPNQTNFDCEALIEYGGFLYLFSKNWGDQKTRVYQLAPQPGSHVAKYLSTFNIQGLVTGAEVLPSGVLLLQGYSTSLVPFTWLFQQFQGVGFFSGSSQRLNWTNIAQTEGICASGYSGIFLSSEKAPAPLPFVATLFYLDLASYIADPLPVTKTLDLTLFLEGLYAGNGQMNKVQDENGDHFPDDIADRITVGLHNDSAYSLTEFISVSSDLSTAGAVSVSNIPGGFSGSYYITVKGRNAIETTSSFHVGFSADTILYDFTSSASWAYGDNMRNWNGTGIHVIWCGDVNQDGIIDSGDMNPVDNASTAVTFGYIPEDINGDGIVDSGDMNYIDNNSTAVILSLTP